MKVTYTQIQSRKILLAFLVIVIVLALAALFVRNSISHKLENIVKQANNVEVDSSKPQQILLLLHQADDDFQESLLNVKSTKSADYKAKLSRAFDEIDTLLKRNADTLQLTPDQSVKVKSWYNKKLQLSGKLYSLKHNFDSLLTAYATFEAQGSMGEEKLVTTLKSNRNVKSKTDTIRKEVVVQKKGLFSRLKDAISNKSATSPTAVVEINHRQVTENSALATRKGAGKERTVYLNKLQELQERNVKMLTMQRELISLNDRISTELENIINEVKALNYNIADEFKAMAFKSYQESTDLLNRLYLAALFLVLVFAVLLIVFIVKLNGSEVQLRNENERAVTIAQQKMDLLLHMSHEIRNPLTAIKGFLYIFSQTELSKRQSDMLDSIRLSSDMLLGTLNDTLDAAKMENSEFKFNTDPFNPDFILKSVIENMEFSATKKKLVLNYEFKGDKEAILLGDSFRLKQIMINLLSNAIKYTKEGQITVNAELTKLNNGPKLEVNIIDTGMGISADQQANLFSKYYQTNSSKGKTGTGLGLYICKQFVELQGGKISVKSVEKVGSTFSFYIPYVENVNNGETVVNQTPEDPLSLLNGITILAVDDNDLNLKFLKMMTQKWNVKFYSAGNGKEALDVLNKENVTVVLTDIQMPEMDGYELLQSIKKLPAPQNKLPIIVISASPEEFEMNKILTKGFSGIVSKPFIEAGLIEQIVKALKG
ncbi:hybrid sensor histidine kinase/response regulator [Pedobacter ginsengisoli]|uniref:histidine kinase n=1 Tax=Pedobacter ginsengisoli TaxID=363852 RepID=A0A2D1U3G0_9SPHI|nr:ATP-binding protein [Pedobacter ginsengisoli]ATP56136.1 hybrid sensor histidine kinase/response regulator [Pedobacter ginsengisoli]